MTETSLSQPAPMTQDSSPPAATPATSRKTPLQSPAAPGAVPHADELTPGERHAVWEVDGTKIGFTIEGDTRRGQDTVLFLSGDDPIKGCTWQEEGYHVASFLETPGFASLLSHITNLIHTHIEQYRATKEPIPPVPLPARDLSSPTEFSLTSYHAWADEQCHTDLMTRLQAGLPLTDLPLPPETMENRVSRLLGRQMSWEHPSSENCAFARPLFFIRIVRPHSQDHTPPHRDSRLGYCPNGITVHVPLAGSTSISSLALAPSSHLWNEKEIERTCPGARVNGIPSRVPAIVSCAAGMQLTRPNPRANEVLLFTPHLIHGADINSTTSTTRVTLEFRLWPV